MRQNFALTPKKYLSREEQVLLTEICEKYRNSDNRNTTMLLLMMLTGLRPGEVIRLKWSDIDRDSQTLFVRTLKGGPPRVLPLSPELMSRLDSITTRSPDDVIFEICYNRFRDIWAEYRPVRKKLHSLRHTFAVNLYKKSNYNLRLVQQALGHSSIQTTAIYLEIQATMGELRKAMF